MDGPISPEALLGATGIRRILSGDLGKITVGDKSKAEMMPREVRRALARFAVDTDEARPVPKADRFDYGTVLDQITDAIQVDEATQQPTLKPALLEKIANSFRPEDHDLASGYLANVQRVIPYLQSILPIRTEQTSAKSTNYDPSDTEIARFRRAYDIADDPMVICRDMDLGILVPDQMDHLGKLSPLFSKFLKAQLGLAMADALARKKSWKLPWRKERVVQTVFGTDTMTPGLAADLQAGFKGQGQQNQGPPPAKSTGKTATMFQTQTAATADGDLRK